MATRDLDLDPGIRITFLSGTDDGDDGASDVTKYAYDSIRDETFKCTLWYSLPSVHK